MKNRRMLGLLELDATTPAPAPEMARPTSFVLDLLRAAVVMRLAPSLNP
jgi:hypothetical protein